MYLYNLFHSTLNVRKDTGTSLKEGSLANSGGGNYFNSEAIQISVCEVLFGKKRSVHSSLLLVITQVDLP
jgi:hypothetical protein